jgi:hypothetical protein
VTPDYRDPALTVRQAAGRYAANGSDPDRTSAAAALSALAGPLLPHLRGEEDEVMPLVSASLTDAEWRAWDQQHNVRGKSLSQLAAEGHWLMDGLDPDAATSSCISSPHRPGSSSSRATPAATGPPAPAAGDRA